MVLRCTNLLPSSNQPFLTNKERSCPAPKPEVPRSVVLHFLRLNGLNKVKWRTRPLRPAHGAPVVGTQEIAIIINRKISTTVVKFESLNDFFDGYFQFEVIMSWNLRFVFTYFERWGGSPGNWLRFKITSTCPNNNTGDQDKLRSYSFSRRSLSSVLRL